MMSFVYIGIDVRTENNQIALIIIQPTWNSHFLTLLFIFDAAIFSTKFGQKINWHGHAHRSFEVGLNVAISVKWKIIVFSIRNLAISTLLDTPMVSAYSCLHIYSS